MAERGQRTRIIFGGVTAEVSLVKSSGKPKAAEHETRRVLVEWKTKPEQKAQAADAERQADHYRQTAGVDALSPNHPASGELTEDEFAESGYDGPMAHEGLRSAALAAGHPVDPDEVDPLGETRRFEPPPPLPPAETGSWRPVVPIPDEVRPDHYEAPPTRVEQGVHLEDGTWIDLTDRLAEVDARTRVEGVEVVATIASSAIARERVRDAHYVAGVDPDAYGVLALLWRALRQTDRAAAVRWTKTKAQALGIIVPRGELDSKTRPAHLVLLEVEWADNMRAPGPRATGPIRADVAPHEVESAIELVEAFEAGPSALNDLRDERLAKRAELLALAREGNLDAYEPPPEPTAEADPELGLAAALATAAAALR